MDRIARIYQKLLECIPADVPERTGCIDVVLFVMILTGQKKGPVPIEALTDHFPNRDFSAMAITAMRHGLLEIDLEGGMGITIGQRALEVLRDPEMNGSNRAESA